MFGWLNFRCVAELKAFLYRDLVSLNTSHSRSNILWRHPVYRFSVNHYPNHDIYYYYLTRSEPPRHLKQLPSRALIDSFFAIDVNQQAELLQSHVEVNGNATRNDARFVDQ